MLTIPHQYYHCWSVAIPGYWYEEQYLAHFLITWSHYKLHMCVLLINKHVWALWNFWYWIYWFWNLVIRYNFFFRQMFKWSNESLEYTNFHSKLFFIVFFNFFFYPGIFSSYFRIEKFLKVTFFFMIWNILRFRNLNINSV